MPPNARPSTPVPPRVVAEAAADDSVTVESSTTADAEEYEGLLLSEPPEQAEDPSDHPPSSLEDAVMRELSGRSLQPRSKHASVPDPPPIVEPSQLRARESSPPIVIGDFATGDDALPLPSIPPDAIVPAASVSEDLPAAPRASPPPASEPTVPDASPPPASVPKVAAAPQQPASAPKMPVLPVASREPPVEAPIAATGTQAPQARRRGWGLVIALGLLGVAMAFVLHAGRTEQEPSYAAPEPPAAVLTPGALSAQTSPGSPSSLTSTGSSPGLPQASAAAEDLPPGAEVAPGFGLLQIHAPARAVVRIDGVAAGVGPFVAAVSKPGYHEVRVDQGGKSSTHVVEVRAGKATQVKTVSAP